MAFGEFLSVGAVDQRYMGEAGRLPAQCLEKPGLPGCVGQMIVAANDMGDAHVMVVDHDRMHIGRRPVAAQQDHVVELAVRHAHRSLHQIVDDGFAVQWRLQADYRIDVGRRVGRVAVAPPAVIADRAAFAFRRLAHLRQFFGRTIAPVGLTGGQQRLRGFDMPRMSARLVVDLAVPIQFQPAQAVENGVDGFAGRAFGVGVLDPQHEAAAVMAGVQPVEQGRSGAADMQEPGRRGSKSRNNAHGWAFDNWRAARCAVYHALWPGH